MQLSLVTEPQKLFLWVFNDLTGESDPVDALGIPDVGAVATVVAWILSLAEKPESVWCQDVPNSNGYTLEINVSQETYDSLAYCDLTAYYEEVEGFEKIPVNVVTALQLIQTAFT